MLSLSQLTPVAYLTDGDILCIECGDKAGLPVSAQLIEYNLESDFEDGCWCGDCGKELVEPYVEDEPEEEDAEETPHVLSGVCKDCGNGTLNNALNPAFGFNDEGFAGGDTLACSVCGSTHLDIL